MYLLKIHAFFEANFKGNIQHVSKWGSGLAVRIPKAIAEQSNIVEGASVQSEVNCGRLMIRRQTHDLAAMVD